MYMRQNCREHREQLAHDERVREAAPAMAGNMACSTRDDVLAQLGSRFGEAPVALGLTDGGALLELLSSEDGKTWTIIASIPHGYTCLIAAGKDWQSRERTPEGPSL